jgi:hypothetical protein
LGSLTCEEVGNLSTRDLGFIYVSSTGRVGCEIIHPAQPTDAPSSAEVLGPISIARCSRGVDPFQRTSASRAQNHGAYSL